MDNDSNKIEVIKKLSKNPYRDTTNGDLEIFSTDINKLGIRGDEYTECLLRFVRTFE